MKYYVAKGIWGADRPVIVELDSKEEFDKFMAETDYRNRVTKKEAVANGYITLQQYNYYYGNKCEEAE